MLHCAGFISAQCSITLVFYLTYTMVHGNTKVKFQEKPVSRWPVTGPSGYRLLASSPASKVKNKISELNIYNETRKRILMAAGDVSARGFPLPYPLLYSPPA